MTRNDNGYCDPHWGKYSHEPRPRSCKGLLFVVGWVEESVGGWVAYARDCVGTVHRSQVARNSEQEAIVVARGMARRLRALRDMKYSEPMFSMQDAA
jgi:hypothetical protein